MRSPIESGHRVRDMRDSQNTFWDVDVSASFQLQRNDCVWTSCEGAIPGSNARRRMVGNRFVYVFPFPKCKIRLLDRSSTMIETKTMNEPYEVYDPFAPPHWRWQVAERIAEGSTARERYTDGAVQDAVNFLLSGNDAERFSALHAAHTVFERDDLVRWQLEGWLLAGLPDAEIAECCRLSPGTVSTYERLFCDVRENAGAIDWLLIHLVGAGRFRGFRNDEVRQFLAWSALAGGPLIVKTLVRALPRKRRKPELVDYLRNGVDLNIRSYVAASVFPTTGPAAEWMIELHTRILEATAAGDEGAIVEVRQKAVEIARQLLAGRPVVFPRRYPPAKRHKTAEGRMQSMLQSVSALKQVLQPTAGQA